MAGKGYYPTFFEVFTALAFQHFSDKNVDYAIIEVGLGGRYDATNIVDPLISVITNVTLEHQNILGLRIEDIAFEKSGIIKKNIPIITASQGSSRSIIKNISKERNSPFHKIESKNWKRLNKSNSSQEFLIKGILKDYHVRTHMMGNHQGENIALAIATVENLQMKGIYISDISIIKGIEKTINPGRMEIVEFEPIILLDGAHNKAGMINLVNTLKSDFEYNKLIVIIGILSDKDVNSILSVISPVSDVIILTKSNNNRACNPSKLKLMIEKIDSNNEIFIKNQISKALEFARSIANKYDLICITGSLYTVGEAREYFSL
jgi:dihydrofolate synthase/folylpolyglutamate synthase